MAEIVNLRRARKAKLRAEGAEAAERNRVQFGVSKAMKAGASLERERTAKRLDQHRVTAVQPSDD